MFSRVQISAAILLAGLLVSGCSEDVTKPAVEPHPRSTKMGLVAYFAQAHENRDIDAFMECLHPDYQFWLWDDRMDGPEWDWMDWDNRIPRVGDIELTERMFADTTVTEIRADFVNITPMDYVPPDDEDRFQEHYVPSGDSLVTGYWGLFQIEIHVVQDLMDPVVDHWVDSRAEFVLAPDPVDSALWTIWQIGERGNEYRKESEAISWYALKEMYRKKAKRKTENEN